MEASARNRAPRISTRALQPVVAGLRRIGLDTDAVLAEVGLVAADLDDPDRRFPLSRVIAFWNAAAEVSGDPAIGLHAAAAVDPSDYKIFWYLVRSSATAKQAAEGAMRFRRLFADSVELLQLEGERGTLLVHRVPSGETIPRAAAEYVLGSIAIQARRLLGDAVPISEIHFAHAAPDYAEEYPRVLGFPVVFGAEHNGVLFSPHLDMPIPSADAPLFQLLSEHAAELLRRLPDVADKEELVRADETGAPIVDRVRAHLRAALPDGNLGLEGSARALHMSPRSLRRRLGELGTSHRRVATELRRDLALEHLEANELSISEIAYLLGFSEPSAFHRAFRRWTGHTPAQHRARAIG